MERKYIGNGRDQINIEKVENLYNPPGNTRSQELHQLLIEVENCVILRLDKSLYKDNYINPGKLLEPEQVECPVDAEILISVKSSQYISPEASIFNVFKRHDIVGKLLILGEAGSGKTTTLLKLAEKLIEKAKIAPHYPIPVLLNLSRRTAPKQTMQDWIVAELELIYKVKKDIAKELIDKKQILPLLDGLNEMKQDCLISCKQQINQWLQSVYCPLYVVVCCRRENYEYDSRKLRLNGAISLQKLTDIEIKNFLKKREQIELWQLYQTETVIQPLFKNPFFLTVIIESNLSNKGFSQEQLQKATSTKTRLTFLFDACVKEMISHSSKLKSKAYKNRKPPSEEQTKRWLKFLAKQLKRESKTEFLIEEMQTS
jgi:predicted NACHT family NTPase